MSYTYTNVGNRYTITYPGGSNLVTYAYDAANNLTSATDWNAKQTTYTYNNAGALSTVTLPSGTGVVGTYTYDNADRMTGISWVKGGSTTLASASYTLDADSMVTQRVDQLGTHTYAYDNLHQLTSATYPGPTTDTYTYDAVGNRLTKNATSYTNDAANRVTNVGGTSYGYDNNGNLTSRGSDSFSWDAGNHLTSATVSATTTTYAYNGDGLRNSRTISGATTTFTWDVTAKNPQVINDGTLSYVFGVGRVSQVAGGGTTFYYLTDRLGSTVALIDSTGTIVNSDHYDVYGAKLPSSSDTQANEYTFTGEQADASTGLIYLRARYYDPSIGRFLGSDKAAPDYMNAGSLNRFTYVLNNPANLTDPSGLKWVITEACNETAEDEFGNEYCVNSTTIMIFFPDEDECSRSILGVCVDKLSDTLKAIKGAFSLDCISLYLGLTGMAADAIPVFGVFVSAPAFAISLGIDAAQGDMVGLALDAAAGVTSVLVIIPGAGQAVAMTAAVPAVAYSATQCQF